MSLIGLRQVAEFENVTVVKLRLLIGLRFDHHSASATVAEVENEIDFNRYVLIWINQPKLGK